jgi:hypothetical protein
VNVDSKAWNSKDFGAWWCPREVLLRKNGSKLCDALSTPLISGSTHPDSSLTSQTDTLVLNAPTRR